ncbi:hypothetical protein VITU102760_13060 [Vibrio tubiashii]|uniref:DUF1240 domain-containing protein n=1 Tax=Vibrio tubiashii ATCC 19109 TaxID=1051646 RepID=F9TA81_9VIBR|nr:hypothetical protein [Vibrio tubiashii]AIW16124.1 hypothetical protein IX91_18675 [Vibrio tubiashii ATCC 19109]EGU50352.1 hypothetical protein VITU9109_23930 [Vibrio tubiashii ATCC 19109]EIF03539.1 hypothetical protein VT1337_12777 [Vibrio tubiashii NCIMB 1337 = ATCC 19106]
MNIKLSINNIAKVMKTLVGVVLLIILSIASLYIGFNSISLLSTEFGEEVIYYRFGLAMIPCGIGLLTTLIGVIYFNLKNKRLDDVYGNALSYTVIGSLALAFLITWLTPSIYESRLENAGLQACEGIPASHLPLFAKNFAASASLCKSN